MYKALRPVYTPKEEGTIPILSHRLLGWFRFHCSFSIFYNQYSGDGGGICVVVDMSCHPTTHPRTAR